MEDGEREIDGARERERAEGGRPFAKGPTFRPDAARRRWRARRDSASFTAGGGTEGKRERVPYQSQTAEVGWDDGEIVRS